MSGSIYQLGVHLKAEDGVSGVLANISKNLLGLHGSVEHLQKGFSKLNVALLGAGLTTAGVGLAHVLDHFEQAGEHLVHAKTMFEAALPPATRMADMMTISAAAWKEAGTNLQSTVSQNIEAMHDLYNVTQSVGHAKDLLPSFNVLKNVFGSVQDGESIGDAGSGKNIASAVRAFELSGRTTADAIAKIAEQFGQTTIALRGRVSGSSLLSQVSYAGDARHGWSDDFVSKTLPAIIANGLANRTGSALYSANSNLYGGVSSSLMQGRFQEKWGLHSKSDELTDENGKFKGFKVGSMWEGSTWRQDPLKWANDLRAHLRETFKVNIDDLKTMQDIVGEIGRGNKGLKSALDELLLPNPNRQLNKEVGNISNVGADAVGIMKNSDPKAIKGAFWAQWEVLNEGFGEQLVKPFLDNVVKPMTLIFRDVSQWAPKNPETVALIGKSLMIVAAGMTALGVALVGSVALAAIGSGGWLVAGIVALSAALATFKPDALKQFASGILTAWDGLLHLDFGKVVRGVGDELIGAFNMLPGMVQASITGAIKSIADTITGLFQRLGNLLPQLPASPGYHEGDNIGALPQSYRDGGNLLHRTSLTTGGSGGSLYDSIMRAEGTAGADPYNTVLGNGRYGSPGKPLTSMTLAEAYQFGLAVRHNPRNPYNSSAIGAFQITGRTMRDAAKALGFDMNSTRFDRAHQEAMATWIARTQGLTAWEGLKSHPHEMEMARRSFAPPHGGRQSVIVHSHLHIKGKEITSHVIEAMLDGMRGPSRGSMMPDDSRANYGPGMGYNSSFA